MDLTSDTSSSDDDIYSNAASRLRALKKKPPDAAAVNINNGDYDDDDEDDNRRPETRMNAALVNLSCSEPALADSRRTRSKRQTRTRGRATKDTPSIPIADVPREEEITIREETTDPERSDDYAVNVKVRWRSRCLECFEMTRYESFERLFKYFAETKGVPEQQVLILKGETPLLRTDTPASVDLKVIDILEGGIIDASVASEEPKIQGCMIRIQTSSSKRLKISLELETEETFDKVVTHCADILEVEPSRIRLMFDGEMIKSTDTPRSLDLEGEACVDLFLRPS